MSRGGKCVSEIMYRVCRYVCKEEKQSKGKREGESQRSHHGWLEEDRRKWPSSWCWRGRGESDLTPSPERPIDQTILLLLLPPIPKKFLSLALPSYLNPHTRKNLRRRRRKRHIPSRGLRAIHCKGSEKVQTTTLWIICEKIAVRLCATACQQVLLFLFLGRSVGRTPSIYLILPQPTSPPMTIRTAQKKRRRGRGWCHYNCTTFSFSISSPWSPPLPPLFSPPSNSPIRS